MDNAFARPSTSLGMAGEIVNIEGSDEPWIVLYNEGEKTEGAQLISVYSHDVTNDDFGYIIDQVEEETGAQIDNINDLGALLYLYNNINDILNHYCQVEVGSSLPGVANVRSVGTDPIDFNGTQAPNTKYTLPSGWITDPEYDYLRNNIYTADTNYLTDYNKLQQLKAVFAINLARYEISGYHFASKFINDSNPNFVKIGMRGFGYNGELWEEELIRIDDEEAYNEFNTTDRLYIRPVIILEPGALSNATKNENGVYVISND